MNKISIICEDNTRLAEAKAVSVALDLPFGGDAQVYLCACKDKWALIMPGTHPMWVEFDIGFWRADHQEGKQEGLIRACKPSPGLHILDLTAGFGRDAAILKAKGAKLTLIERDPIMQLLLKDGLARALKSGVIEENDIQLICADAENYLLQLNPSHRLEVIYLDPMHPTREKSAKVKKMMQSLQTWIEPNHHVLQLLALARTKATARVVVKWPARLPPLLEPNHSILGKTIRFDVYLPNTA